MNLSPAGTQFIAAWEGFRANWYDDGTGVQTIGYGHTGPLPPGFTAPLTPQRGLDLLAHDARPCIVAVNALPPVAGGWTQSQFDALVCFCFNCGVGAIAPNHAVYQAVESKPRLPWPLNVPALRAWKARVQAALLLWDHAGGVVLPGLQRRRLAESYLFAHEHCYTQGSGNPYANS